jgi:IS5 family transposase
MALYTVRSERQFCEQLNYNLLFRWFLDMDMTEQGWEHSSFTRNRERLLKHEVAEKFFYAVVEQAKRERLTSSEHFTVDGTLVEAWASLKSFKNKDGVDKDPPDDPGNPTVDFRGEKRTNDTHASTTDPEARLAKKSKGKEARLSYSAHALMENRNGLLMDFRVDQADGQAEWRNALTMLEPVAGASRITVGGDKGYDVRGFVEACRKLGVTPHIAQNLDRNGGSAIDGRTTRCWLHRQPAHPKARRRDLRLEQDRGQFPQDSPRRLGEEQARRLHGWSCVQLGPARQASTPP